MLRETAARLARFLRLQRKTAYVFERIEGCPVTNTIEAACTLAEIDCKVIDLSIVFPLDIEDMLSSELSESGMFVLNNWDQSHQHIRDLMMHWISSGIYTRTPHGDTGKLCPTPKGWVHGIVTRKGWWFNDPAFFDKLFVFYWRQRTRKEAA